MKEFIFIWSIENISYSWHKNREKIVSPSFVADTLFNTVWNLQLYPRGCFFDDWIGLYLYRGKDKGPKFFLLECELSCISANNLTIASRTYRNAIKSILVGDSKFLKIQEVFDRKKALYLQQDILKFCCRMWIREGDVDEFGQSFGCTRLEIERTLLVEDMNPRITKKKSIYIHTKNRNKVLMLIDIFHEEDGLKIEIFPRNARQIKFSTFKFSAIGRNRKLCKYMKSWLDKPCKEVWEAPFSNTEKTASVRNKLTLTCEFIYSLGKETKSVENISPCSIKFSEFPSSRVLGCIPSRKLSDCPRICKDLWDLYTKKILCDVELKTQTRSFCVHKTVLCARSSVFLEMFTGEMKSNCITLEDLDDNTLEQFLTFLYTDRLEESFWDTVVRLYYLANKYKVERLKYLCGSYFRNKIDDLRVCELLMLAHKHSDCVLKSKVEDYVVMRHETIFRSPMWKQFSEKEPLLAAKTMLREYDEDRETEKYELSSYPNAMDDFRSLYQSQEVSDIVIQTTNSTFLAHKTILYAGSSILRRLIARRKSIDSLKMRDLEDDIAARLLLFLYTDSLGDIDWETATKLYHAAVSYQIERLKIQCSCFFLEKLQVSNAENLLQLAHEHQDARLESLVEDFISLNDADIIVSEDRKKLGKTDLPKRIETRRSKRLKLEKNN